MFEFLFNNSYLSLEWPLVLLLLPLPFLIKPARNNQQSQGQAAHIPLFLVAQRLKINHISNDTDMPRALKILLFVVWFFLVLALSRPVYVGEKVNIPQSGRDLMLAIDISPSMKEKDLHLDDQPVTRLTVVKKVVSDFISERQGDRLGLILFGSEPYIQSPLSFDLKTINTLLNEAFLGMAGQATAIGDAIGLGVKRLKERPEQSRVIILLSDGANTTGDIPPEKAAQLATANGIKIYTIGIGADEMYKRSFFGSQVVNPSADLDEEMLTLIANETGGKYFRARKTEDLAEIYTLINQFEPIEQNAKVFRPKKSLVYYCLITSFLLWLSYQILVKLTQMGLLKSVFKTPNGNSLNERTKGAKP